MLDDPPILTVKRPDRRPTQAQIDAFKGAMTGNVVDCMGGRGAMAVYRRLTHPYAPAPSTRFSRSAVKSTVRRSSSLSSSPALADTSAASMIVCCRASLRSLSSMISSTVA